MTVGRLAQMSWPWVVGVAVFLATAVAVKFIPGWLVDALAIAFLASWVLDGSGLSVRLGLRRPAGDVAETLRHR
ncbi:hypothetical protein [Nocardia cyriacigeorgica]|uniref:hypothetical protein n=1 Tax=Nocardia cyriacigeorgica TaxID=135487 RepID=UPI002453F11F|nr:hypothetical protein [Nocardia cyriacigeorgica]